MTKVSEFSSQYFPRKVLKIGKFQPSEFCRKMLKKKAKICQKYENLEKKYHFEPRKLSLIIQSIQSIFIYMIYYHLDQLYSSFQHGLSLITSVISSIFMAQNVKKVQPLGSGGRVSLKQDCTSKIGHPLSRF